MGAVKFSDAGSATDEGKLSVTIDPATADEFFDLYVVNGALDGSYQDTNVDISDDWDNLTFVYNPAHAVAITLDGMVYGDLGRGLSMMSPTKTQTCGCPSNTAMA